MSDDDTLDSYEALLAAFEPRRALLTLSHAVRLYRQRPACKTFPASYSFRVFHNEDPR